MTNTRPTPPLPSPKRKRDSREGTVTTSMALPRVLHQEAMVAAVALNWTLAAVVRAALDEWLVRNQPELPNRKGGWR